MKKSQRKLSLSRDTVRILVSPALRGAAGGGLTTACTISAGCTLPCTIVNTCGCPTNGCPTRVQNCTNLC